MNIEYQEVEENFGNLISLLNKSFISKEIDEIKDFVDYGEYGLALDTLIDIIKEENKEINNGIFQYIAELSNLMEQNMEVITKDLIKYINFDMGVE
ncbi:MAG: MafI family immunity protein [Snodgrassella sp.]|uniref:MafI family immunity protein n=1 Tax=Snodgrassella TaxID=1193515 RepID=UPI001EF3E07D|nr:MULTISPECIES: MafI family immunity protein [Snodgrassella]MCO6517995.1 MafI family immunity protein [Snodgrassella sp.]MCO6521946.1 MafI family immunity protein [Snodgrassella sp.]